jgi:hypothetical protein
MAKTDLSMLTALETVAGKLSSTTAKVFRQMREDLERGTIVNLSPKQRKWVSGVYVDQGLDKLEGKEKPAPTTRVKKLLHGAPAVYPWERTDDKPLKPPGRR